MESLPLLLALRERCLDLREIKCYLVDLSMYLLKEVSILRFFAVEAAEPAGSADMIGDLFVAFADGWWVVDTGEFSHCFASLLLDRGVSARVLREALETHVDKQVRVESHRLLRRSTLPSEVASSGKLSALKKGRC